jgi:hypothetical protein
MQVTGLAVAADRGCRILVSCGNERNNAMNDLQGPSAIEQLRQALDRVAGIFDAQLRRSEEYGTEIEAIAARQKAESDRLAALERALTADRTALQQMGSIFAEVARRSDPATTPAAVPQPQPTAVLEPQREVARESAFASPPDAGAETTEPMVLTTEAALASPGATLATAPPLSGHISSLTVADLVAASSQASTRNEFVD